MMIDPIFLQIPIGVFGVFAIAAFAVNRIFLGCIFAIIAQPFWVWSAYQAEQWGVIILLSAYTLMYLLGIFARWPRKPPPTADDLSDEHEWLGV